MNKRIEIRHRTTVSTWKICTCFVGVTLLQLVNPALAADAPNTVDNAMPAVTDQSTADDFTTIRNDLSRMENRLRRVADVDTPSPPNTVNKETEQGSMPMQKKSMGMKKDMDMGKGMDKAMGMGMNKGKGLELTTPDTTSSAMGGMQMMSMMGKRPSAAESKPSSGLPGFTDADHLYHLGEQGFFLEHTSILSLSMEQTEQLERIKLAWQARNQEIEKKIELLEVQLWQQTAEGKPDRQSISKTIRNIEGLRGDLRLAFIDSVGSAVNILSREQITKLITFSNQSRY